MSASVKLPHRPPAPSRSGPCSFSVCYFRSVEVPRLLVVLSSVESLEVATHSRSSLVLSALGHPPPLSTLGHSPPDQWSVCCRHRASSCTVRDTCLVNTSKFIWPSGNYEALCCSITWSPMSNIFSEALGDTRPMHFFCLFAQRALGEKTGVC